MSVFQCEWCRISHVKNSTCITVAHDYGSFDTNLSGFLHNVLFLQNVSWLDPQQFPNNDHPEKRLMIFFSLTGERTLTTTTTTTTTTPTSPFNGIMKVSHFHGIIQAHTDTNHVVWRRYHNLGCLNQMYATDKYLVVATTGWYWFQIIDLQTGKLLANVITPKFILELSCSHDGQFVFTSHCKRLRAYSFTQIIQKTTEITTCAADTKRIHRHIQKCKKHHRKDDHNALKKQIAHEEKPFVYVSCVYGIRHFEVGTRNYVFPHVLCTKSSIVVVAHSNENDDDDDENNICKRSVVVLNTDTQIQIHDMQNGARLKTIESRQFFPHQLFVTPFKRFIISVTNLCKSF